MVMAPTHEEVLTSMVKFNVFSYRDLHLVLYQIQTKFRDEERPRGGLLRVREFDMKDAYSFHVDEEGLDKTYNDMIGAYQRIYERCGLEVIMVEADSGAIGGKASHEFMALSDVGEDTVIMCESCGYAANEEKAAFDKSIETKLTNDPIEEIHTPNVKTIEALVGFLNITSSQTLKSVMYDSDGELMNIVPIKPEVPQSISKQTWNSNLLNHSTVITPDSAWPNIHMVEVVRSCPELCRFCLASYLTLPFRSSKLEESLIPAVEKGLQATKRIGLLGASVTQHPQFEDLLSWLAKDIFDDIHLSVSSVRASTVTSNMVKVLSSRGSKSLTIAIESGSERLRQVINKKLSEEEIFAAAKYAYEGGLKSLKLYNPNIKMHENSIKKFLASPVFPRL